MMRHLFTFIMVFAIASFSSAHARENRQAKPLTEADLKSVPTALHHTIIALQDMPHLADLQRLDRSIIVSAIALSSANPRVTVGETEAALRKSILRDGLSEGLISPIMNFIDQAASKQTEQLFGIQPSQSANAFAIAGLNELSPKAVATLRHDFGLPAPTDVSMLPKEPHKFREALMKRIEPMELLGGGHGRDIIGTVKNSGNSPASIRDIMFGTTSAFGEAGYAKDASIHRTTVTSSAIDKANGVAEYAERGFKQGPFGGAFCFECGTKTPDAGGDTRAGYSGTDERSVSQQRVDKGVNFAEKALTKRALQRAVTGAVALVAGAAAGPLAGATAGVAVDLLWGENANAPVHGGPVYSPEGGTVGIAPSVPPGNSPRGTKAGAGTRTSGDGKGGAKGDTGTGTSSDGKGGTKDDTESTEPGNGMRRPQTVNKADRMDGDGPISLTMPDDYEDNPRGERVGRLDRNAVPERCLVQFSSSDCVNPWRTASFKRKEQLDRTERHLRSEATKLTTLIDNSCIDARCQFPGNESPMTPQPRRSSGRLGQPNSTPRQLGSPSGIELNDRQSQMSVVGRQFGSTPEAQFSAIPYLDSGRRQKLEMLMHNEEFRQAIGSKLEQSIRRELHR